MNLLLEKTRNDLLNKSRTADVTKSYGTTRYERRSKQHLFNTVESFNKIDMNSLFKADILYFKMPIHGETNDYQIDVMFDGVCKDIQKEVKDNNNKLEFKCIYKALIRAINSQDIYVGCNCPDFKFRFQYWGTKHRYNSLASQLIPAKETNPNDSQGAGCKHIMNVLANVDWALKLATVINNYVSYMDEHMHDKYIRLIFPSIYGMTYDKAVQLSIFDDPDDNDLANSVDNAEDEEIIDDANEESKEEVE